MQSESKNCAHSRALLSCAASAPLSLTHSQLAMATADSDISGGWSACESRLLDRLLYKYHNQHRKTPYFHKLQQVRRAVRTVEAEVKACVMAVTQQDGMVGAALEQADVLATLLAPRSAAHVARLESLAHGLVRSQRVLLHCSRPLYGLLAQTYFMSFALAALALLARLYATQRVMLMPLLDKCVHARISAAAPSTATATATTTTYVSVAQCLHRSMRTEVAEREWVEHSAACSDIFTSSGTAAGAAAKGTSASFDPSLDAAALIVGGKLALPQSLVHAHSDGDSDEDEDATREPVATPTPLPSQLKFFASPAATLKQANDKKQASTPTTPAPLALALVTPKRPLKQQPSSTPASSTPLSSPGPAAAVVAATPQRNLKRPASAALSPLEDILHSDAEEEKEEEMAEAEDQVSPMSVPVPVPTPAAQSSARPANSITTPKQPNAQKPTTVTTKPQQRPPIETAALQPGKKKQKIDQAPASLQTVAPARVASPAAAAALPRSNPPTLVSSSKSPSAALGGNSLASKLAPVASSTSAAASIKKPKAKLLSNSNPPTVVVAASTPSPLALLTQTLPLSTGATTPTLLKPKLKKKKAKLSSSSAAAALDEMDDIFG